MYISLLPEVHPGRTCQNCGRADARVYTLQHPRILHYVTGPRGEGA